MHRGTNVVKRRNIHLTLSLRPSKWCDPCAEEVGDLTDEPLDRGESKPFRVAVGAVLAELPAHGRAPRSHHRAMLVSSCVLIGAIAAVAVSTVRGSPAPGSASALDGQPQVDNLFLQRGASSAHFAITALTPSTHTYNVLVDTAASADVSVHFQTWYGQTLGAQYSTQGTLASNCVVKGTRMTCLSRFPELGAERAGTWTVIASKRSGPPVAVRVSVIFQSRSVG
jgi:hypothetical protein